MYLMRNHDVWIYVRCANSDPRIVPLIKMSSIFFKDF